MKRGKYGFVKLISQLKNKKEVCVVHFMYYTQKVFSLMMTLIRSKRVAPLNT